DTDATNDKLAYAYPVLQGVPGAGYYGGGTGSIASATTIAPFNDASARNGGTNYLGAYDGFGDWGGTSTNINDTNYMLARSPMANSSRGGGRGRDRRRMANRDQLAQRPTPRTQRGGNLGPGWNRHYHWHRLPGLRRKRGRRREDRDGQRLQSRHHDYAYLKPFRRTAG